ncbi:MAG TPA: NADH-quinone oxidoreductase subunit C [Candidatus Sulfomarinibacteraceae bacterium]|nr:NADH-quinone oxidoreductase subunit C [Candidatus Sulfomarinibacteraceae bacterium]
MNETSLEQRLQRAEELIQPLNGSMERPAENRLDVSLDVTTLLPVVKSLLDDYWGYLAAITGLDLGPEVGEIEVLYHFCSGAAVVTLRVRTGREEPAVPTVCDYIPSASFYERELSEMLGVEVEGTPDPSRLFLPDEWPAGVYPLRKDYEPGAIDGGR